ncbi:MAG: hypothetical protein H7Y06_12850, partial [Opitutaceae bacterium]|nr:hypothetical protein [Opitutaceae bacterium]
MKLPLLLALCVLMLGGCATSESPSASAASAPAKQHTASWLFGEWTEDFGPAGAGSTTFNADGTYTARFYSTKGDAKPE